MPLSGGDAVAIGVPVRDEAALLPNFLSALAHQVAAPPFALCLFFDNCTDDSEAIVASFAGSLPYPIRTDRCARRGAPSAGLARMRAMALAATIAPRGLLLTTDADGAPRPDWIAANLAALAAADIVAGRIVRAKGRPSERQNRIETYYDRLHALRRAIDPVPWEGDPTHHWTSAASMAMPAAVYGALGGFAPIPSGEDARLGDAAARAGYRLRRDAGVVVETSARRRGRADGGFATALALLDDAARMPATFHPEDEAWRFQLQAQARRLHGSDDHARLARRLHLPLAEVDQVAAECRNGEAFAARIVGAPPGGMRSVGLSHAELLLAALERSPLEGAA